MNFKLNKYLVRIVSIEIEASQLSSMNATPQKMCYSAEFLIIVI